MGAVATEQFVHEALFYDGEDDYLSQILAFVADGLDEDHAVLVAVPQDRVDLLRPHVDGWADERLRIAPMEVVGRNPAWIIPVWAEFVASNAADGRPVRGVGEPIWSGRTTDELVECARHEALLNVAFASATGFRLLCPYDSGLDPAILLEAEHNHPHVCRSGSGEVSHRYDADIPGWLESPLTPVPRAAVSAAFGSEPARSLRQLVAETAEAAGLCRARTDDAVLAVSEAVTNSVDHGGGGGELALWPADGRFIVEVRDHGHISDPLVGRTRPTVDLPDGRGLWLIHQLSDLVQLRTTPDGLQLRMQFII